MHEYDEYKTAGYNVDAQKWFCPNCSALIIAYPDESGKAKKRCCKCGAAMTKYKKKRGINIIEIREPEHCRV